MSDVHTPSSQVPVCVVGTSAGGVTALQTLFKSISPGLGLAYAVALHLSSDQPSLIDTIISSSTTMPVEYITETAELRPDHVYIISPNQELRIDGDNLIGRLASPQSRYHIDTLFLSCAQSRNYIIAIVLTGAGHDGTAGVRAIKEAGGIVIVQDPEDAEYPAMPQSAIESGSADFIEPLAQIPIRIADVSQSRSQIYASSEIDPSQSIKKVMALMRVRTGHDFSKYKSSTIFRRVNRRAQICKAQTIADYAAFLDSSPSEADALLKDLLISVTSFFRDAYAYDALRTLAIRSIFQSGATDLRVWSIGCASGEEAYSVAMLILEEAAAVGARVSIQLFATDLDEDALAKARTGIYPRAIEADVSAERLDRFFIDEGLHYKVRPELRDIVLFASHSVMRDPPFMRLDLVICRNLLIYFDRSLQQQVSELFRYALNDGGYLFLGPAETPDTNKGYFETVDRDGRIYRARPQSATLVPPLMSRPPVDTVIGAERRRRPIDTGPSDVRIGFFHLQALDEAAPPSLLVDGDSRIIHLSERAGRFLALAGGPVSENLPALLRPEIRSDAIAALDQVFASSEPVITRSIDVEMDGSRHQVRLYCAPLSSKDSAGRRALICFLDGGKTHPEGQERNQEADEIRRLQKELGSAQQLAVVSRDEHRLALQNLRAANEELQSLNEEYRSTAEELETSKEELQSVNEELHTVNAELRKKVQIVSNAHNDLLNLTSSSEIGTLFLDRDLKIRMFTPPVRVLFSISEIDIGRNIFDFTHRLKYMDLKENVSEVLASLQSIEKEVLGPDERTLLLRIRPYRTIDHKVTGVVVTFNDITKHKSETTLSGTASFAEALIECSFNAFFVVDAEWSEMRRLVGKGLLADLDGPTRDWMDRYLLAEDVESIRKCVRKAVERKTTVDLTHRVRRLDGNVGWVRSRAIPIIDDASRLLQWIGSFVEVAAAQDTPSTPGEEQA